MPRQSAAILPDCGDLVDVALEGERHDVGLQAVDHGAGLGAGAAMRLLDGDRLAGLFLPVGGEGLVVGFVEFAGRVVGDVQDGLIGRMPATSEERRSRQREGGGEAFGVWCVIMRTLLLLELTPNLDMIGRL